MTAGQVGARKLFQLGALLLVCWGIYLSVRNSAVQLRQQQTELTRAAEELRQAAIATEDAEKTAELKRESQRLSEAARNFWKADPIGLLLASGFYLAGMLPASLFWRRCLLALDQPGHVLIDVLWAYFYGNLGKYFPGKAMVIVLRVAALEKYGVKKTATSMTVFMETLTMMSVGGAMAAVCLIVLDIDWRMSLLAVGLLVSTFVPTSPPVLKYLLPKLQRGVDAETLRVWTDRITWRLFFRGWLMLTVTWLAFGLSLMFILRSLPSAEFDAVSPMKLVVSAFGACALAVVLGFVSLIPGGAGVREVVLSAVLSPVVGPVAALCAALWLRIVWLCTELGAVGFLGLVKALPRLRLSQPAVERTGPA